MKTYQRTIERILTALRANGWINGYVFLNNLLAKLENNQKETSNFIHWLQTGDTVIISEIVYSQTNSSQLESFNIFDSLDTAWLIAHR